MIATQTSTTATLREWGEEALAAIEQHYWKPDKGYYIEELESGEPSKQPAFMWDYGVQLSAFVSATQIDRAKYEKRMISAFQSIEPYWTQAEGIGGYDVQPNPGKSDRYYDDNEWIVLSLADAYEITKDKATLKRAIDTQAFAMSGEDSKLGGGIYWQEAKHESKNTCSNAPAIVGALRLFQITHEPAYLAAAKRLYTWTNAHLQDKDGLFWDSQRLDDKIEKTKWTYNSALMIRANVIFYHVAHDPIYRDEAKRIAKSATLHWVDRTTGAIKDDASFAHLLADSFLDLYAIDQTGPWRETVLKALTFLHDNGKDAKGLYPKRWDGSAGSDKKQLLLYEASAARGFLRAALSK